jgi:hypothetical protein
VILCDTDRKSIQDFRWIQLILFDLKDPLCPFKLGQLHNFEFSNFKIKCMHDLNTRQQCYFLHRVAIKPGFL